MNGALDHSGEQFKKDALSVNKFNGFMWKELGRFVSKLCDFKNIRIRVDGA